ncbi:MAG: hypothetical protein F6K47_06070 [Symploca sp. SIO2E6]|nr:hypothetical protein [Symploca sp. SIO2E6]
MSFRVEKITPIPRQTVDIARSAFPLAIAVPQWLREIVPVEWFERYGSRGDNFGYNIEYFPIVELLYPEQLTDHQRYSVTPLLFTFYFLLFTCYLLLINQTLSMLSAISQKADS